jgi:hypothetical protein
MTNPSAYYAQLAQPHPSTDPDRGPLRRYLLIAVIVLGLVAYGMGFGPLPPDAVGGWGIRFAVLAAVAAALTIVPAGGPRPWLAALLAVPGFLDALADGIGTQRAGWALVVIVVLTGLQAVAAVAAAYLDTSREQASIPVPTVPATHAGYPYYGAYQAAFVAAQQQTAAPTQAHAGAEATADAAARQAYEAMRARYAEYTDASRAPADPRTSAPAAGPGPGMASAGYGAVPTRHPDAAPPREERRAQ